MSWIAVDGVAVGGESASPSSPRRPGGVAADALTRGEADGVFEVGESTVHAMARVIERAPGTQAFDPQWTLPSLVEKNPLVWMAEVNGLLVDLRNMPREVQEIAFEDGLIPYIPADHKEDRS